MDTLIANIERALRFACEHVFLSLSSLILLHFSISVIFSWWNLVHSHSSPVDRRSNFRVSTCPIQLGSTA